MCSLPAARHFALLAPLSRALSCEVLLPCSGCCAAALRPNGKPVERCRMEGRPYTFSDEIGRLHDRRCRPATARKPIRSCVSRGDSPRLSPVTLVIRADFYAAVQFDDGCGIGFTCVSDRHANGSGQGWIEFEFELQEILHQASVFGDGLSFDQRNTEERNIYVGRLRAIQPRLRALRQLLFRNGKVDPRKPRASPS